VFIYKVLSYKTTERALTNKRVINKKGIISRKSEEIKHNRIETVEIVQSILGRIFGYAKIEVYGIGSNSVVFNMVKNPLSIKKVIEENTI